MPFVGLGGHRLKDGGAFCLTLSGMMGSRGAQRMRGGGVNLTPLAKSPYVIVKGSILGVFHSKFNFQKLLFSSVFRKIMF